MTALSLPIAILALLLLVGGAASIRILKQYERGVQFRLGRVKDGARGASRVRRAAGAVCRASVSR